MMILNTISKVFRPKTKQKGAIKCRFDIPQRYANITSICNVCFSSKDVLLNYKVSIAEIKVKAYLLEA